MYSPSFPCEIWFSQQQKTLQRNIVQGCLTQQIIKILTQYTRMKTPRLSRVSTWIQIFFVPTILGQDWTHLCQTYENTELPTVIKKTVWLKMISIDQNIITVSVKTLWSMRAKKTGFRTICWNIAEMFRSGWQTNQFDGPQFFQYVSTIIILFFQTHWAPQ